MDTSMRQAIGRFAKQEFDIVEGHVVSAAPLAVQLENDSFVANSNLITVPRHLGVWSGSCTVTIRGETGQGTVTVDNRLKAGDHVVMLSYGFGKKYYILDRK